MIVSREGALFGLRVLLSLIAIAFIWVTINGALADPGSIGYDANAYWGYPRDPLYAHIGADAAGKFIYRYSPAFIPILTLFTAIPWPVFVAAWIGCSIGIYIWLAGPWWLALLAFAPFVMELRMGNVHMLLALAIVLGFRWPAAWAFVLLTKVTPGVGLLWFAVRREWRSLGIALGATALIVGISAILAPGQWAEWFRSLLETSRADVPLAISIPLWQRLIMAIVLVTWGARTDRRWTVVVAATLALPTLWFHGLAMLVGVVAIQRGLPERASTSFEWLKVFSRSPRRLRPEHRIRPSARPAR